MKKLIKTQRTFSSWNEIQDEFTPRRVESSRTPNGEAPKLVGQQLAKELILEFQRKALPLKPHSARQGGPAARSTR